MVFTAVLADFAIYHRRGRIRRGKESIVETGTMTLFFLFFYTLLKKEIGSVGFTLMPLRYALVFVGLTILILGCGVNIAGRFALGKNWANQIKIYHDHQLVVRGVYSLVRHPLYASIIWMFYGASLIYLNMAAFLANTCVFIPFMYYRARQEESLLSEQFKEYDAYRGQTGMFFPKIRNVFYGLLNKSIP